MNVSQPIYAEERVYSEEPTGLEDRREEEGKGKYIFVCRSKTELVAQIRFPMGHRLRPKPNAVHLLVCFAL